MSAFLQFLMLVSNVAVQELQEQPGGDSKSLNVVRCTSLKQDGIIKDECSFSPLQNLLLYYPGNQEMIFLYFFYLRLELKGKFPENEPDKSSLCSFIFPFQILHLRMCFCISFCSEFNVIPGIQSCFCLCEKHNDVKSGMKFSRQCIHYAA